MSEAHDQQRYRSVIAHFATGVAVVTAWGPEGAVGMTANAVCSLSLDPLLVLVCFDNQARTLPLVRDGGRFAVNVLSREQHRLSGVFASKLGEHEKFEGVAHTVRHGLPVIDGVLAWLACDLRDQYPGGDHTIGIGAVTHCDHGRGDPLVWYRGAYTTVAASREDAPSS